MHSKGKVKIHKHQDEGTYQMWKLDEQGRLAFSQKFTKEEDESNAERMDALWNAAKDMTTEAAIKCMMLGKTFLMHDNNMPIGEIMKYITHGPEMVEALRLEVQSCRRSSLPGCPADCGCETKTILAKLDKEGA